MIRLGLSTVLAASTDTRTFHQRAVAMAVAAMNACAGFIALRSSSGSERLRVVARAGLARAGPLEGRIASLLNDAYDHGRPLRDEIIRGDPTDGRVPADDAEGRLYCVVMPFFRFSAALYLERRRVSFSPSDVAALKTITTFIDAFLDTEARLAEVLADSGVADRLTSLEPASSPGPILGTSTAAVRLRRDVAALATARSTAIRGEPGTGKTFVARVLHSLSERPAAPMIVIRCSSSLATHHQPPPQTSPPPLELLAQAEPGSTLLFEEVQEVPAELEDRFLLLVERLRSVRLIVTASPGFGDTQRGDFASTVLSLIEPDSVDLVPLRERLEDILPLAQQFILDSSCHRPQRGPVLSPAALKYLLTQPWQGNIRELRSTVMRAAAFAQEFPLTHKHFRWARGETGDRAAIPAQDRQVEREVARVPLTPGTYEQLLDGFDRGLIARAIAVRKSIRGASLLLGISRNTLKGKMAKYGLSAPESDSDES